jgi:hypothetical protein
MIMVKNSKTKKNIKDLDKIYKEINREIYYPDLNNFFLNLIKNHEIKVDKKKYPNSIFYMKNGKFLFEYDKEIKDLFCSNERIWAVLENKFKLNHKQTQEFIKDLVETYLNLKDTLPRRDD